MEFLGVGPAELFFILVLALLVIGPERLPEAGRFLGRQVARVMAWQQQSSEVQAIQQIRQEFQDEIVSLRNEMTRTRKHLDANIHPLQEEIRSVKGLSDSLALSQSRGPGQAVPTSGRGKRAANGRSQEASEPPTEPGQDATAAGAPDALHNGTHTQAEEVVPAAVPALMRDVQAVAADQQMMLVQVQALMQDMHALLAYLREQGVLSPEWEPPSHRVAAAASPSSPSQNTPSQRENESA
jgi:sec-independent protein translocase protein TatB